MNIKQEIEDIMAKLTTDFEATRKAGFTDEEFVEWSLEHLNSACIKVQAKITRWMGES